MDKVHIDYFLNYWNVNNQTIFIIQGTTAAAAVCSQINGLSDSITNLTGLTLTSGDVYTVEVIVSAAGRTAGVATQQVMQFNQILDTQWGSI